MTPEPDETSCAEPAAGDDESRGLYCGGESDSLHHSVMQHGDDYIVPVMVFHHQSDLSTGFCGCAGLCPVPSTGGRAEDQRNENPGQPFNASMPGPAAA